MRNSALAATVLTPLAAALLPLPSAMAGTYSPWSAPTGTAVRLVAGASEGERYTGGIEVRLAPGWKTYWRYPGDSGIPPRFDWSGSDNLASVEVDWPTPARFDDGDGNFSIGYKHDVVLPIRFVANDIGKPVNLRLGLDFAVCEKICQPAHAQLTLDVPAGGAAPSSTELIEAQQAVPRRIAPGAATPLAIERIELEGKGKASHLRIEARVPNGEAVDLFVEGPTDDWALPLPKLTRMADGRAEFLMQVDGVPKGQDLAQTPLRFTLTNGNRAVEVETPPSRR